MATIGSFDAFAEVRSAITLSEYVEFAYGSKLRSSGQGKFSTACPVHGGDNATAFKIDDALGLWRCFSQCGRGGDIFTLYEATNQGSSKKDALVALAAHGGVTLPEREKTIDRRSLYRTMGQAAEIFNNALTAKNPKIGDSTGAAQTYDWITSERGLSDDEMDLSELGFVPDFHGLRAALEDALGPQRLLVECGILVVSAAGNVYCPFAGRLVFPIRDRRGRVVAFGARVVPEVTRHQEPKFVNSRQSEIYDKSNILYGMDFVTDRVERVVVCEGYLDAIAVNALDDPGLVGVAACGTSITESHIDVLLEIAAPEAEIVFAMDGDNAGQKSMARLAWAARLLGARGFGILLNEEDGKDPWERFTAGTLSGDVSASAQQPLVDACTRANLETSEDNDGFDKAISSILTESPSADFSDDVLRSAAAARGVSVNEYGEKVRRVEMSSRRRGKASAAREVSLSGPVRHLVSRLMQIRSLELRGVTSAFDLWGDETRGFIERWLPVEGQADISALGYVLFPRGETYDSEVIQAVSSCMVAEEDIASIDPVLRGLSRVVLSQGARVAREASLVVLDRVKAVRSIASAEIRIDDEVENLVLLVDVARELDAVEA